MEQLLHDNQLKATPGRLAMLATLTQDTSPKTAEQLFQALKQEYDLVTIYRNLEAFQEKGIIYKEEVNKKDYYYMADKQHHHIICNKCETMKCVPCSHKNITVKNFTRIRHQLILTGVCHNCSA